MKSARSTAGVVGSGGLTLLVGLVNGVSERLTSDAR